MKIKKENIGEFKALIEMLWVAPKIEDSVKTRRMSGNE